MTTEEDYNLNGTTLPVAHYTPAEPGCSIVKATTKDGKYSVNFTVISQPVMPETVELKEGRLTLHEGESQSLTATLTPEPTLEKHEALIWKSYDESVATVDETGKITAVAPGFAFVTVSSPYVAGAMSQCIVEVLPCQHAQTETVTVPATCEEDGSVTVTCKACGKVISTEVLPKGHTYTAVVTEPTCTEGGYTLHECACGDSYRTDETAALGHNYVESDLETYTCTRCGDTYTDHTHSYTTTVVEPTCTEDGYTLHACACGYSYQDNVVSKLGHRFIVIAEDGENATYRCTRCGHTYTSPISIIDPPNPPVSQYSLGDEATTTGCGSERVLKSTVTEEHSYIYAGGRLLRETITTTAANGTVTTKVLDFAYDAQGTPYSLTYTNGTASPVTYYYITNLQGDVTYLINGSGTKVASYSYDPYGQIQQTTGSMAQINPLRYRGYYYDSDTEFHYLQSRYYDAAICRFINADSYSSTGQGIIGYNMFAYCGNNPVSRNDKDGEFWNIIGGAIVGALVGVASQAISNLIDGNPIGDGLAKAAVTGAVGGALTAAFPGANTLISAGMSAAESVISDVQNGENLPTILVNATLSAGFAAATSGSTIFGDKDIVTKSFKAVGNILPGNHPNVKKVAKKLLKKTGKAVLNEIATGVADGVFVNYVNRGTKWVCGLYTGSRATYKALRS